MRGAFTISLWYESSLDYYYFDNPTPLIDPGGVNQLGVIGEGTEFAFFINGLLVGEIVEELLPFGSFSLANDLDSPGQLVLEFDNFKLRTIAVKDLCRSLQIKEKAGLKAGSCFSRSPSQIQKLAIRSGPRGLEAH